jgi:ketosteroid isomerase-like protein
VAQGAHTPAGVSHRFAEAINAGDVDGALACWSPAAVIVAPDRSEVRGHKELAERFRRLIDLGAQVRISVCDEVCTELGATATTRMTLAFSVDQESTVVETTAFVAYVPGPSGLQILIDRLRADIA